MATAYQATRRGEMMVFDPATLPIPYAVPGKGDCMEPVVRDGTTLVFDRTAEPEPGDVVVIWFRPEHSPLAGTHAMVKRLVSMPPVALPFEGLSTIEAMPTVVVEMLNPPRLLVYPAAQVLAVHKCIGEAENSGDGTAKWRPAKGGVQ